MPDRQPITTTNPSPDLIGMYDPLTELYNRPLFIQVAESLLRISIRQQMPVSLAIVNIDHYEELCEELGHQEANNLIKECANIIKNISRDSDVLAHFEEDQFALLLYNCNQPSSQFAADRLRAQLEDALSTEQAIHISIGLATFSGYVHSDKQNHGQVLSETLITNALHSLKQAQINVL